MTREEVAVSVDLRLQSFRAASQALLSKIKNKGNVSYELNTYNKHLNYLNAGFTPPHFVLPMKPKKEGFTSLFARVPRPPQPPVACFAAETHPPDCAGEHFQYRDGAELLVTAKLRKDAGNKAIVHLLAWYPRGKGGVKAYDVTLPIFLNDPELQFMLGELAKKRCSVTAKTAFVMMRGVLSPEGGLAMLAARVETKQINIPGMQVLFLADPDLPAHKTLPRLAEWHGSCICLRNGVMSFCRKVLIAGSTKMTTEQSPGQKVVFKFAIASGEGARTVTTQQSSLARLVHDSAHVFHNEEGKARIGVLTYVPDPHWPFSGPEYVERDQFLYYKEEVHVTVWRDMALPEPPCGFGASLEATFESLDAEHQNAVARILWESSPKMRNKSLLLSFYVYLSTRMPEAVAILWKEEGSANEATDFYQI